MKLPNISPYMGGVGKGQGMPTQAVWAQGGYVTMFQKMPTQKPLIRKFQNHVFLNAYANVYQMHTISFPVYFLKVRYSSEAVCICTFILTMGLYTYSK